MSVDTVYDRDAAFWENYMKGRPRPPQSFYDRMFKYHEDHGGRFDVAHDIGAGVAPFVAELKKRFKHVIVSDIAAPNVEKAKSRLGTEGYSFHVARVEDKDHLEPHSVDMVFATNVMHFPDVDAAQRAIARQLKAGGSFVCGGFAMAVFDDNTVAAQVKEMIYTSLRANLRTSADADDEARRLRIMAGITSGFRTVPAEDEYFHSGAQRVTIHGGIEAVPYAPPELIARFPKNILRVGQHDQVVRADDPGWEAQLDLQQLRENLLSFAFMKADPSAFEEMWRELEKVVPPGTRLTGVWPCTLLLASRR